ncbi:oligoendopeptidase F [uncultured Lacticaseibacillus sp.]|uniref:oligoendopeptidase F n=1 Tax=uncultured Lacticaseibacillus sp. TaxID=2775882 RepID=UPI00259303E1|nr:oligoendopeptidase F [uncultured Lacticaseibacillus sp.]
MTATLPTRDEVPTDLTWDLSTIFADDAAWQAEFTAVQALIPDLKALQGTLGQGPDALASGINQILAAFRRLEKVYVYASLKSDQDTGNSQYLGFKARVESLATSFSSATAFMNPEIIAIPADTLNDWVAQNPELQHADHFLDSITAERDHVLDAATESLLAAAGDALDGTEKTFNVLNNSDIDFGMVQNDDGDFVELSHGLYDELIHSTHRDVRQGAFESLYATYDSLSNTFAATLSGKVKADNFRAEAHRYPSARAAAINGNHIPESVFTTLVEQVNAHLPLLHRYVALRKRVLGLDELHSYDLYTPLTGKPALSYNIVEAKGEAERALSVLGDDYVSHVHDIYDHRMVDFVENSNKRSGAYSGGAYDTNPFILMSWHDSLDSLYTLVHETGHSVHSWYSRHNQDYMYGDYPIFVAEIASTTNENLLTDYLLKHNDDPQVRAFLLNYYLDGFKGTIFRQTQFAEFEDWIHRADQAGTPLTADAMSDQYAAINAKYYGDALVADPEISLEWARIPHFYYNYYVYQYATGFAAATTLAKGITTGTTGAVDHYLGYLKGGSAQYAIDTMRGAGVDMTKPDYLEEAFGVFEDRLSELEQLL